MPDIRCFDCSGLIEVARTDTEASLRCPRRECGAAILLYKCFSCMKLSVLDRTALPQTCPRCFTILRTNRPLVLKPFGPQRPRIRKLTDFGAFCGMMNGMVGPGQWTIVGGYASYLHIAGYARADAAYLRSVESQILPSDMELAQTVDAERVYKAKYEQVSFALGDRDILVTTFAKPPDDFADDMQRSVNQGAYSAHTPAKIIEMYKRGGNPAKKEKRILRSAILTVITRGDEINQENVDRSRAVAQPMLGALNLANPLGGLRKGGVKPGETKDPGK